MRREGFYSTIVVKDDERAFLTRDGRFVGCSARAGSSALRLVAAI